MSNTTLLTPPSYRAFATDFDGTLAHEGHVPRAAFAALERLRAAGWHLLLVTGREIEDLARIFSRFDLFDIVVAENGALLFWPADSIAQCVTEPPPLAFVERLHAHGVGPISVGHAIIATWEPHEAAVLDTIKEMGLELQIIFNKGAVMILPTGVNKASGLEAALQLIGIAPTDVVGVGDAENDHALLDLCGYSAAVANAIPAILERADYITQHSRGDGVAELIDHLLSPETVPQ